MYNNNGFSAGRSAFSDGDLATASPARVLVKCFDRLDADLDRALISIEGQRHEATNAMLGHAQDLLGEMVGMLDVDAWEHVDALLAVYDYVLRLIAVGNMEKHAGPIREARHLLGEIGEAFRAAADEVERSGVAAQVARASTTPTSQTSTSTPTQTSNGEAAQETRRRPGFSVLA
jgi:flagellin-specific chaperone FliS